MTEILRTITLIIKEMNNLDFDDSRTIALIFFKDQPIDNCVKTFNMIWLIHHLIYNKLMIVKDDSIYWLCSDPIKNATEYSKITRLL